MASKHFFYPDLRNRLHFVNKETNHILIKSFLLEMQLTTKIFMSFYKQVYKQSPKRSKVRNRCIYSLKSRSVSGKYHFSRMALCNLFSNGYFPGIRNASW